MAVGGSCIVHVKKNLRLERAVNINGGSFNLAGGARLGRCLMTRSR